tara:strand:- start:1192 stop:2628 length:1437 start_codon:yes stop_codon:yes gene_type:complete
MAKILLVNPSKWGRGITPIWVASHSSILKENNHEVKFFDATFYSKWTFNETEYNTNNKQYRPTGYLDQVTFNDNDIIDDFLKLCNEFKPEIIFWSALSSHIHGEGEYVNIQYGYEIAKNYSDAVLITGGLQATAVPFKIFNIMSDLNFIIRGESEVVLNEFAQNFNSMDSLKEVRGLSYISKGKCISNRPQDIIKDMDIIPHYDYSIFDPQIFLRPYNGKVIRAVDYELSRGCMFACDYCVETIIQKYYGFEEVSPRGTLINAKNYLRNKSAKRIFQEISNINKSFGIKLFRCQDTNFLSINRKMLMELAEMIDDSDLDIIMYIETRPEGINPASIDLLKKLKVDGIGMGIELSSQDFREDKLNRFADTEKIIRAFKLLKEANIKRTTYNIIGLPDQDENSILETINFNRLLEPDNVTVAFYSPYIGTSQQITASEKEYFNDYENDVDGQLRSLSKHSLISIDKLNYYKEKFVDLVMN